MSAFRRAERTQVKMKLALTGPSGAGKTMSALLIASGMGKRIALVDTENYSASLYGDRFDFDTMAFDPPYLIQKYTQAIEAAEREGYDVLILDSISHAWAGDGGLLAKKESLDARGGNSFANWGAITKEHEQFKAKLLNCKIHLICTMRSKQDYVLEVNEKGKQTPRKVGLAPIQRDSLEYEFSTVLDLGMDHNAIASKDRTGLFDGQIFKPTKATGEAILEWLQTAKPAPVAQVVEAPASAPVISPEPVRTSGVKCSLCNADLILHSSGAGYLCPNSKDRTDGHLRFPVAKLAEFQARQSA